MKQLPSFRDFNDGSFLLKTDDELISYPHVLSTDPNYNPQLQHLAIIRAQTINDLLMKRHIEKLDKQSAKTQHWFMVLAVASLIASLVDISKEWLF